MPYPDEIEVLAADHVDAASEIIAAADINALERIVTALQQELGIAPSATFANVAARLASRVDVRKTADQVLTGTGLLNVTDLSFPVVAGNDYKFAFDVPYTSTTLTNGIGFAMTCPALSAGGYISYGVSIWGLAADGTGSVFHGQGNASGDTVLSTAVAVINSIFHARIDGILSNPSVDGTLQVQGRSEVTSGGTTIKKAAYGNLFIN